MKRHLLLSGWMLLASSAFGQLPDGSTAPNWTAQAIPASGGQTYTLYNLLNTGKVVFIDFSATWCGPCWNYHNTHALRDLYNAHGPAGDNKARVFMIEGDANTNVACLSGPAGCVGGTQGDWVAGTTYPIIDDEFEEITADYQIAYFPTIYAICPMDKDIHETGQQSASALWSWAQANCPPFQLTSTRVVTPTLCYGSNTGSIQQTMTNGTPPYTHIWSNGATTKNISNLAAGTYSCTSTDANGFTGSTGPVEVGGPTDPITVNVVYVNQPGCFGMPGAVEISPDGGTPGYTYLWNNGQTSPTLSGAMPGTYTCTVKDANNCPSIFSQVFDVPINPIAAIAAPPQLTCAVPTITLNGNGSSNGPDFIYQWTTAGGNIVSGANTLTPVVNAAGTYYLEVTNTVNNCEANASKTVTSNISLPSANAGAAGTVTCSAPSTVLNGSGSTGNDFTYLWTATNGGNIVSGGTTLTPTVNAAGSYSLVVTNTANGCTLSSSTSVTGNNIPPTVSTTGGTITCAAPQVTLTGNSPTGGLTWAWTGPNGYTSDLQNPTVSTDGTYNLQVTSPASGCTNVSTANVDLNNTVPTATAAGGAITCTTSQVTLNGSSSAAGSSFTWTGPNGYNSTEQNPTSTISGTYDLVVVAPNGCSTTAQTAINLNQTAPTTDAGSNSSLNCNASIVTLNGSGSSQGNNFTYLWTASNGGNITGGANTLTPTADAAGDYNLLVTNTDNGCTSTDGAAVILNLPPTATIANSQNIACFGGNNGSATAVAGQGNGVYSYAWSNGATTASISGLAAGTYSVVVTDGENCTATNWVGISQPDQLFANASSTAQQQNGQNDGTATALPGGGTGNYSYSWSNGGTTQTITNLAPGAYTVIVSDENGCSSSQTVSVNSVGCALASTSTQENATCFGNANGSATVTLTGGVEPVSYLWSNGQTGPTASGLIAGNYSVEILDAAGCPATLSVQITQPPVLASNATATSETSFGGNNGTATASPTGGVAPFSYLWSNGGTSQTISGLAPAVYTVEVTDANGCQAVQNVVVGAFTCSLQPTISQANNACFGENNGVATITLGGGIQPFTILWSNGQTTATASNLSAGQFTVVVTDAANCQTTEVVNITEPAALTSTESHQNVLCPTDNQGEITVSPAGGTPGYSYLWSNGMTTATISGLTAGQYSVVITDANGCQQSQSATISSTDSNSPVITLKDIDVQIDDNGLAQISGEMFNDGSTDDCGIATWSVSTSTFDCSQIGTHTVTVTALDGSGNLASGLAQVTVADKKAPSLTCPNSITTSWCKAQVNYSYPVAIDNCTSLGGQWNQSAGLTSGATFPLGATTNTFSYTDASGNVGECSFEVIILDQPTASAAAQNPTCAASCNGSINLTLAGGNGPFEIKWSNGDTGPVASELCGGPISFIVKDAAGCEVTTELDMVAPPFLQFSVGQVTNEVNGSSNGSISIDISGGTPGYSFAWSKNGQPFATTQNLTGISAGIYEVVVTDANGCVVNSQQIEVQNTVAAIEPTWAKGLKLLPNPTTGQVQLTFNAALSNSLTINVLDANGRTIRSLNFDGNQSNFDLDFTELAGGVYWLSLISENEWTGRRLVIAR